MAGERALEHSQQHFDVHERRQNVDTIGKAARTASGFGGLEGGSPRASGGSPRSPLPVSDVLIDGFTVPQASHCLTHLLVTCYHALVKGGLHVPEWASLSRSSYHAEQMAARFPAGQGAAHVQGAAAPMFPFEDADEDWDDYGAALRPGEFQSMEVYDMGEDFTFTSSGPAYGSSCCFQRN